MSECDKFMPLLSGLLDGELTTEEARQINDHLIRCASCRDDYEQLQQQSSSLSALSIREPQEEALADFWRLPYSRTVRNSGLFLLIGGYIVFLCFGLFNYFTDDSEMLFGKLSVAAMVIGGIIVFGVVLIERLISYKTDPYKEVKR
jgi:anti-sigma factor RsiW